MYNINITNCGEHYTINWRSKASW